MERLGYTIPAEQIVVNTYEAEVGAIAVFNYDGVIHYAFTQEKLLSNWARIEECNMPKLYGKVRCGTRNISPDTPHFLGYYVIE